MLKIRAQEMSCNLILFFKRDLNLSTKKKWSCLRQNFRSACPIFCENAVVKQAINNITYKRNR